MVHHHTPNQLLAAVPAAYSDPTCQLTTSSYILCVHGYLFIRCAVAIDGNILLHTSSC